jgi:hypothetical protein
MLQRIKPKWNIQAVKHVVPTGAKGQSLVEMAIITPLLLLLFIGVLEVGWAIRGYIVLVNADREATRFAARGQYLDFSQTERENVGYDYVAAHTLDTMSQQLDFDVLSKDPNATLIVSHYLVDTGKPCAEPPCNDDCDADNQNKHGGCDCSTPDRREPDFYYDDLILHPGMSNYEHFTALYGIPRETQINHDELIAELKEQNDAFNCSLNAKDPSVPWVPNSVVVVETFYSQPQLLGVPIVSNYFTDPIPLYAQTVMRIASNRGGSGSESEGQCMAWPITFHEDILGDPARAPQQIDAYEGNSPGNFGWITWNPDPANNNANYVEEELDNPQMSMTDFIDVNDPNDDELSIGDDVSTGPGVANSDGIDRELLDLVGKTIIIPVYDNNPGTGQNAYYHISHFAEITVKEICLPRNSSDCDGTGRKQIIATFKGYVDDTCGGVSDP